jgi:hypothetical protein
VWNCRTTTTCIIAMCSIAMCASHAVTSLDVKPGDGSSTGLSCMACSVAGLAMPCVENKPKEYPQQPEKKRLPNTQ